jgi:hypothetical protein
MVMDDEELKRRLIPPDRRIFLSYARLDDEVPALDCEAKGWVCYFYDQLQLALRQWLGGNVAFWRDLKDIDENELFEDLIKEGLEGSAHLLAVVSPCYLKSRWCQYELNLFVNERGGPKRRDTIERVIKVLKHHMDEASLHKVLQDREGYRFFSLDPDSKREMPFYFNGKMVRPAEYIDVLIRLAHYLVNRLKDERLEDTPKPVVAPTEGTRRTIFLALPQGTDTSEPALRVRNELKAAKLAVCEPPTTPTTKAEACHDLREVLGGADAAVHIVGRSAGAFLHNGQKPAVHLQLEESGRWADERPGFRRYILLLATHKEGNAAHQDFVGRLQQDLAEGGLLRPDDELVIEQPGGTPVQEFINVVLRGLTP